MANLFQLHIVTPDRVFYDNTAESLTVHTPTGEMGIMAHTLPMIALLQPGILRIYKNGRYMEAANSEGVVSVLRDAVTVLTQSCDWPYEVDAERVDKERKAKSIAEYKTAKAQLAVQFAKLKIKNHGD